MEDGRSSREVLNTGYRKQKGSSGHCTVFSILRGTERIFSLLPLENRIQEVMGVRDGSGGGLVPSACVLYSRQFHFVLRVARGK